MPHRIRLAGGILLALACSTAAVPLGTPVDALQAADAPVSTEWTDPAPAVPLSEATPTSSPSPSSAAVPSPSSSPAPTPQPSPTASPPTPSEPSATAWPTPSLIDSASPSALPAFPATLFRTGTYRLARLPWSELPYNGQAIVPLDPPSSFRDAEGIGFLVRSGLRYYNPGSIAQEGCRYLDAYVRTGDPAYLHRAQQRAVKLRSMARPSRNALWLMYLWPSRVEQMAPPWPSALAQGAGVSFFVRLYRVTGKKADLATARSLMASFRMLGTGHSPWVAYVDSHRLVRLEEYPGPLRSHVFNGSGFAFFGIYDYAMLTGDPTAVQLARGYLATMRATALLYRVPGGISWYDLAHLSRKAHYHAVDTWELEMFARMGGGSWFSMLARVFAADDASATYP